MLKAAACLLMILTVLLQGCSSNAPVSVTPRQPYFPEAISLLAIIEDSQVVDLELDEQTAGDINRLVFVRSYPTPEGPLVEFEPDNNLLCHYCKYFALFDPQDNGRQILVARKFMPDAPSKLLKELVFNLNFIKKPNGRWVTERFVFTRIDRNQNGIHFSRTRIDGAFVIVLLSSTYFPNCVWSYRLPHPTDEKHYFENQVAYLEDEQCG